MFAAIEFWKIIKKNHDRIFAKCDRVFISQSTGLEKLSPYVKGRASDFIWKRYRLKVPEVSLQCQC